jgi:hypothetical protein
MSAAHDTHSFIGLPEAGSGVLSILLVSILPL